MLFVSAPLEGGCLPAKGAGDAYGSERFPPDQEKRVFPATPLPSLPILKRRMKVLISAYACEPERGSEPGIGWNWARSISDHHSVWILTQRKFRKHIEETLARAPLKNARFTFIELPSWALFIRRGRLGSLLHYYLWQIMAYLEGRRLHEQVHFDLVHHVTFGKFSTPSFLAMLGPPFVWGPVGGGESAPSAFWKSFSFGGLLHEVLRSAARSIQEVDPFVRLTSRRARHAFATSEETAKRMRLLGCSQVFVMSSVALPDEEIGKLARIPIRRAGPFRVLSMGRLLHWKGFELGVRAFAEFHRRFPDSEYHLVGDGPESKRLKRLADDLGIGESTRFHGEVTRASALRVLAECDVLMHPSLHDSGGWVCSEAMGAGRPVICLDLSGPALQVTEETGFKIPAVSPRQAVRGLADALYRLASDAQLRALMGEACRKRVMEHLSWQGKAALMVEFYDAATRSGSLGGTNREAKTGLHETAARP